MEKKKRVVVPKTADRAKVVGRILDPGVDFVEWAGGNCCFSGCTYCNSCRSTS